MRPATTRLAPRVTRASPPIRDAHGLVRAFVVNEMNCFERQALSPSGGARREFGGRFLLNYRQPRRQSQIDRIDSCGPRGKARKPLMTEDCVAQAACRIVEPIRGVRAVVHRLPVEWIDKAVRGPP